MTIPRYIGLCILVELALLVLLALQGCVTPQQLAQAQHDKLVAENKLATLDEELADLRAQLDAVDPAAPDAKQTVDELVALITEKSSAAQSVIEALQAASDTINESDSQWGSMENILTGLGAFFPPAAVGGLMLKRARGAFDGVVASVHAGGGMVNVEAARAAQAHYPGLKHAVTNSRVRQGFKVRTTAPADTPT